MKCFLVTIILVIGTVPVDERSWEVRHSRSNRSVIQNSFIQKLKFPTLLKTVTHTRLLCVPASLQLLLIYSLFFPDGHDASPVGLPSRRARRRRSGSALAAPARSGIPRDAVPLPPSARRPGRPRARRDGQSLGAEEPGRRTTRSGGHALLVSCVPESGVLEEASSHSGECGERENVMCY